ncbi:MAG: hypothetical protein NZ455_05760 [Bacteroidia bacterium]|nr:hypothetical protein [Bacteroidia bacterium]MDW8346169.1 hypothetical protein [Bacteroidia bacterium]
MRRVRQQCGAQAKHRSDSAARSTPTRSAAKGHAQKLKNLFFTKTIPPIKYHFTKKSKHHTLLLTIEIINLLSTFYLSYLIKTRVLFCILSNYI